MKARFMTQPDAIKEISEGQFYINANIRQVVDGSMTYYECDQVRIEGEPTYAKAVDAFIRERYSVSDELALHRQKDTKPEDFAVYNTYCESCKSWVRPIFYPTE